MTVTVIKCSAAGRPVWRYEGELADEGPGWLCLHAFFDIDDRDDGYFRWQRGDLFIETYYHDRYYNVNRIHDRDSGALRGWYCNIARPVRWEGDALLWEDLELDVFITPAGELALKDEDDFQALVLSAHERALALDAVAQIRALVAAGLPPFDRTPG